MTIDEKFIGKEYSTITYQVGAEKVYEFVIATKGDLRKFANVSPPTFPVVYGSDLLEEVLFDEELNLNLGKLVHGEQEFIYYKPVHPGDVISTAGRIEKIFSKGPHDFVVFLSRSINQESARVCDSIWTFVIRGGNDKDFTLQEKLMVKLVSMLPANPADKSKQESAMKELMKKTDIAIDLSRAKQDLFYYEQLSDTEAQMQVFIDKYMPQVYAGASGDFNIIHLDESFGRSVGLGGYILHGMATMAMGANFALYGQDPEAIKRYKARFSAPVKPLDTLSYRGAWSGKEFKFNAVNQKGQEVLSSAVLELN